MTMNYRKDHVLVRASEFRPGDIGRLNEILDDARLGQPLLTRRDRPPAARRR